MALEVGAQVLEGAVGRPHPQLAPHLDDYVGYRYEGFGPGTHQGLPSRHVTFIVTLAGTVDLSVQPGGERRASSHTAFVSGLHSAAATIEHDGHQHGIHLDVTPRGARALFGLPAGALTDQMVDLDDLWGRADAVELVERVRAAAGWPERFAVLDELARRRLQEHPDPPPEVDRAWQRLLATGGGIEVGALAREVGWSRRHLGQRFRAELGLSPKVAARVLRFERSTTLLRRPDRPSLAEVAATCGYYDQAHLTREWRSLAATTPAAWLADDLPSVQDDEEVRAAG